MVVNFDLIVCWISIVLLLIIMRCSHTLEILIGIVDTFFVVEKNKQVHVFGNWRYIPNEGNLNLKFFTKVTIEPNFLKYSLIKCLSNNFIHVKDYLEQKSFSWENENEFFVNIPFLYQKSIVILRHLFRRWKWPPSVKILLILKTSTHVFFENQNYFNQISFWISGTLVRISVELPICTIVNNYCFTVSMLKAGHAIMNKFVRFRNTRLLRVWEKW